jgi:hypothetical protein
MVGIPTLSAAFTGLRAEGAATAAGSPVGALTSDGSLPANLQGENVNEDLRLLALQSEIQRHDRRIALASNMMKARHDTAKAAIGNIRA